MNDANPAGLSGTRGRGGLSSLLAPVIRLSAGKDALKKNKKNKKNKRNNET
jgi:hypothetical protein